MGERGGGGVRVALVCTEFAGATAHTGGVGRLYRQLATALAERGVSVEVVLEPAFPLAVAPGTSSDGDVLVHVGPHRGRGRSWRLLRAAWSVRRRSADRSRHYDAVIAPEWEGVAALLPRAVAQRTWTYLATDLALVRRVEGLGRARRPGDLVQLLLERTQVRRSARLLACSDAIAHQAGRTWRGAEVHAVVPNGIDVGAAAATASASALPAGWPSLPEGGAVVLFVGRLEARKGAHVFVEAVGRVLADRPATRAVMVGREGAGAAAPAAAALRRLPDDVAHRIAAVGDQSEERVLAAMRGADVVVLPSLWEAFGIVALEAMAAGGGAVVATGGSGFDTFCTSGVDSVLVPPGDVGALAAAVGSLLDDPARRRRLAAAAALTAPRYDVTATAERLLALVAGGAGPTGGGG
jgi:glycogen(starch) synthase